MIYILLLIILLLLLALGYAAYKIYTLITIIMVFEKDIATTIESLNECDESLKHVISLRLFFENESVRPILETARNEVNMCRLKVRQMATRFIERSEQKYVIYEEPIEIEKVRGIPGTIDDDRIERNLNINSYRQSLGEDQDVVFVTENEFNQYQNKNRKI